MKQPDNALNVDAMNVKQGGKQPMMRSTKFNGEVQEMTLPDGTPQGNEDGVEGEGSLHK